MPTWTTVGAPPPSGKKAPSRELAFGPGGIPLNAGGNAAQLLRDGGNKNQNRFVPNLVKRVLDIAGEPAATVAYLADGNWSAATRNARDLTPMGLLAGNKTHNLTLSQTRGFDWTNRLPTPARIPLQFGVDVAGDPLNLVSFGAGGTVRKGLGAGASTLLERSALSGVRMTAPEVARAAAKTAAERSALTRVAQVNFRVPGVPFLARPREIPVGRVNVEPLALIARRAAGAPAKLPGLRKIDFSRVGDAAAVSFKTSRGASKQGTELHQAVRRWTNREGTYFTKEASALQKAIEKRARILKVKPEQLSRSITLHLDDPARHDLPRGAEDLVTKSRGLLDEINKLEMDQGIRRGVIEDYVPHLVADQKALRRAGETGDMVGPTASSLDNPFFVKSRVNPDARILDLEASGHKMETDIARLVAARGAASARARAKHALDAEFLSTRGVTAPLLAVPGAAKAEAKAAQAGDRVQGLLSDIGLSGGPTGRQVAAAARGSNKAVKQGLKDAKAAGVAEVRNAKLRRDILNARAHARVANAIDEVQAARFARDPQALSRAQSRVTDELRLERELRTAQFQSATNLRKLDKAQGKLDRANAELAQRLSHIDGIVAKNSDLQLRPGEAALDKQAYEALQGEGWRSVTTSHSYNDGTLLSPADAKDLERVHRAISDSMQDPAAVLQFLRQTQGLWKRTALATPGFHIRNLMDDMMRGWWGGARNPKSWEDATRVMMSRGSVKIGRGKRARIWTADQMMQLADDAGATNIGFVSSDVRAGESYAKKTAKLRHSKFNYLRASENVGDLRDNWTRLGFFIEQLKNGHNVQQAAERTRTFMFDYGETGAFVNTARLYWTPFITFASKVIPLTAKTFAANPRIPAHIGMFTDQMNREAGNPDLSQLAPDQAASFGLPTWLSKAIRGVANLPQNGDPVLLDPKRAFGYATLNDVDPRNFQSTLSNYLGPFVKTPIETATGYSFYRGKMFPASGVRQPPVVQALAGIPGIGDLIGAGTKKDIYTGNGVPSYSARLDSLLRSFPPFTQVNTFATTRDPGASDSAKIGWLRTLAGPPIYPYDRARAAFYAERFGGNK